MSARYDDFLPEWFFWFSNLVVRRIFLFGVENEMVLNIYLVACLTTISYGIRIFKPNFCENVLRDSKILTAAC